MNAVRASLRALARIVRRRGSGCRGGATPQHSGSGGRKKLIQRILSTIHNNSILLCGDPGSGKTSILLHLKERLAADEDPAIEFFPVYIDLRDVPERLLFVTVARAVTEQLTAMPLLDRMTESTGSRAAYGHRELAHDFRSAVRHLRRRSSKQTRLVLLIDNVDELNTYAPRTTQRVRSLFMASIAESLVMVASAVTIDKQWQQEGSPWYNFFEELKIPPVNGGPRRPG